MTGAGRAWRVRQRLGARDLALLASLRELRLMTGAQLRRLHFPGGQRITQARKTRAAVTRLAELDLIVRMRRRVGGARAGSEGYVIGLSGLGHAVLDIGTGGRRHRAVRETSPHHQAHLLGVAELCVRLHEHTRECEAELLDFTAEPGCWRQYAGIGGQRLWLKPDAFVRIGLGEYALSHFIEHDEATESPATIGRKLDAYVDYWRSGREQHQHGVFPLVWWLVPHHQRASVIAGAIRRLPTEARQLFTIALHDEAPSHLLRLPEVGGQA